MNPQFREQLIGYSDQKLAEMISARRSYTSEAVTAILDEAEARGGADQVFDRVAAELAREQLVESYRKKVREHVHARTDVGQIVKDLAARGIAGNDVADMVAEEAVRYERELYENTETPRSAALATLGAIIATLLGSVYSRILIFGGERVFFILVFGLIALCYGLVRWFAGGKRTTYVLVLTIISVTASLCIGLMLTRLF